MSYYDFTIDSLYDTSKIFRHPIDCGQRLLRSMFWAWCKCKFSCFIFGTCKILKQNLGRMYNTITPFSLKKISQKMITCAREPFQSVTVSYPIQAQVWLHSRLSWIGLAPGFPWYSRRWNPRSNPGSLGRPRRSAPVDGKRMQFENRLPDMVQLLWRDLGISMPDF